jgi:DNA-binding transcriptional LysR family regulator
MFRRLNRRLAPSGARRKAPGAQYDFQAKSNTDSLRSGQGARPALMSLIDNMRLFVRTVECGSLSAGARSLRISPAVASHRLKVLEEHLGIRLLQRTTRQIQPTAQGVAYYEACVEVFRALDLAEGVAADLGSAPKGSLRVTAPLGFTRDLMAPLLPAFRAAHPLVSVQLRLSDHLIDILREGVDLAVRLAQFEDSSFTMRKICRAERVLCAAPDYLARRGEPRTPADLLQHECLLLRFPGSRQFQWELQTPSGPERFAVAGGLDADDGDVLTGWALAGHGIVLKPLFEVIGAIRAGALRPVLPDHPPVALDLAMIYPTRQHLLPRVRAFCDFMVPRLQERIRARLDAR